MITRFYLSMMCANCDEEIFIPAVTNLEHNGLPNIPFDAADQSVFHCAECGADNYTGDFSDVVNVEGGDDEGDDE